MVGRIYSPEDRRFLTPDPATPEAALSQGLNGYAYVRNNPATLTDPTGYRANPPGELNDPRRQQALAHESTCLATPWACEVAAFKLTPQATGSGSSASSDDDTSAGGPVVWEQSTVVRGDGAGHGPDNEETPEELENQEIAADVLQTGEALNTTADGLDLANLGGAPVKAIAVALDYIVELPSMVKSGFNAVGADGPAAAIGNVFQATTSLAEFWMATATLANLGNGIREAAAVAARIFPRVALTATLGEFVGVVLGVKAVSEWIIVDGGLTRTAKWLNNTAAVRKAVELWEVKPANHFERTIGTAYREHFGSSVPTSVMTEYMNSMQQVLPENGGVVIPFPR
jgi:hypothetical protein